MKEEALKLANELIEFEKSLYILTQSHPRTKGLMDIGGTKLTSSADMIRKLVAELDLQEGKESNYFEMINDKDEQIALLKNSDEPFGWIVYNPNWFMESHYYVHGKEPVNPKDKSYVGRPLYTAPQTKPLSDDWQPDVKFEEGVFKFDLPNGDEFVIVPPQTKPLSDEEIMGQWRKIQGRNGSK